MKKTTLLIIAISFSTFVFAQQQLTKDQQEVQQTVIYFFDALSNRDSVNLKKYSTPDIVLLEYGSIWNIDTLILKAITLNTSPDFKRINNFDFISTTVTKNTAWTTYNLHTTYTRNGSQSAVDWMETVVLVKKQKKWKIKLLHSSLIKRS